MVALEKELPEDAAPPSAAAPAGTDGIPLRLRRQGGSPRQVLVLTLIGTLVLAVFASRDLSTWLDRMGGGPLVEPLQNAAAAWDGAMDRLGLARPHDVLRSGMRRLLEGRW